MRFGILLRLVRKRSVGGTLHAVKGKLFEFDDGDVEGWWFLVKVEGGWIRGFIVRDGARGQHLAGFPVLPRVREHDAIVLRVRSEFVKSE